MNFVWKHVRPADEHLVSGYIRTNSERRIATAIVRVCTAFFVCIEEWDRDHKGSEMEIHGDCNDVCESTRNTEDKASNYQTVYGRLRVKKGVHRWTRKLTKNGFGEGYWRIVIGVIGAREMTQAATDRLKCIALAKNVFVSQNVMPGLYMYGFVANNQNDPRQHSLTTSHERKNVFVKGHARYGISCTEAGDVIEMRLDLNEMKLALSINGVDHGYTFKDMERGEYRLALTLGAVGIGFQIVSYEKVGQ